MISSRPPSCAAAVGRYEWQLIAAARGEESPPTLIDISVRDRRWARQSAAHEIIGSAGLRFISRMHLGVGIMSYLSSPMWLVMIGIGFALAIQSRLIRPEYFSHDFQLFPTWPRFDAALMMSLFWFSMVVLLIPKTLGLIRALLSRRFRRGAGGVIGITASFLLEAILSALYAPILMIVQCRHVFEVFMGRDSGWNPQRRDAGHTTWGDAWRFHRRHMLLACVTAVSCTSFRPPCWLGFRRLCSVCFWQCRSRSSAAARPWAIPFAFGLLRTPEEMETPPLVRAAKN